MHKGKASNVSKVAIAFSTYAIIAVSIVVLSTIRCQSKRMYVSVIIDPKNNDTSRHHSDLLPSLRPSKTRRSLRSGSLSSGLSGQAFADAQESLVLDAASEEDCYLDAIDSPQGPLTAAHVAPPEFLGPRRLLQLRPEGPFSEVEALVSESQSIMVAVGALAADVVVHMGLVDEVQRMATAYQGVVTAAVAVNAPAVDNRSIHTATTPATSVDVTLQSLRVELTALRPADSAAAADVRVCLTTSAEVQAQRSVHSMCVRVQVPCTLVDVVLVSAGKEHHQVGTLLGVQHVCCTVRHGAQDAV